MVLHPSCTNGSVHVQRKLTRSHSHLDATSATLKPNTAGQDNPVINSIYKSNIAIINTAVISATHEINALLAGPAPYKRGLALASRQATVSLPGELALIIEEIGGTLNEIIATLGLSKHILPSAMGGSQLTLNPLSHHTLLPWSVGHIFGRAGCISHSCCEQSLGCCRRIARRYPWRIERRFAWAHFVSKLGNARYLGMVETCCSRQTKGSLYPVTFVARCRDGVEWVLITCSQ